MATRQEEIRALKAGEPLPSHRVVQLRSLGMHSIRFEFVVRLLRSSLKVDTLSIYWEQGNEFMLKPNVESAMRRLVFGRRKHVSGEFADLWLLCYPDDEEIPCPHLHLYREGYGDRWAMPLPAERFSDAGDPWLLLLEFMQFVNVTMPPDIRRGLFT